MGKKLKTKSLQAIAMEMQVQRVAAFLRQTAALSPLQQGSPPDRIHLDIRYTKTGWSIDVDVWQGGSMSGVVVDEAKTLGEALSFAADELLSEAPDETQQ